MRFKDWVSKNYDDLYTITRNICNGDELMDDLFQEVMVQLLPKKDLDVIPDDEKKYYFISVVRLNYHSKTSRFHYKIRKPTENWFSFDERDEDNDMTESLDYIDKVDMNWVKDELQDFHWYKRTLFEMWIEEGTITSLSKKTTINKNTCGQHIREIKEELQRRWDEQQE